MSSQEMDEKPVKRPPLVVEVPVKEIDPGNRFRMEVGNLQQLKDNILATPDQNVIQSFAIMPHPDPNSGYKYKLLGGGRRHSACMSIDPDMLVPCRLFSAELDELDQRTIELSENIFRKDFTWQERLSLEKEIERLQVAKYGEAEGKGDGRTGWGQADTATILGVSPQKISTDMKLHRAIEIFPELQSCRTQAEAEKKLAKIEQELLQQELASRIKEQHARDTLNKTHKELIDGYIQGDFLALSPTIGSNLVDFVEIDPPYGIDFVSTVNEERNPGFAVESEEFHEWDRDMFLLKIEKTIKECVRIMKPNAWLVCWSATEWIQSIVDILLQCGLEASRRYGVWTKPAKQGRCNHPQIHLTQDYEMFVYARKGEVYLQEVGHSSVFHYGNKTSEKRHITEKPIALYDDLLPIFCPPGSRLLSPFLGSGNILLAAANRGIKGFGYDLSEVYRNSYIVEVTSSRPGLYGRSEVDPNQMPLFSIDEQGVSIVEGEELEKIAGE